MLSWWFALLRAAFRGCQSKPPLALKWILLSVYLHFLQKPDRPWTYVPFLALLPWQPNGSWVHFWASSENGLAHLLCGASGEYGAQIPLYYLRIRAVHSICPKLLHNRPPFPRASWSQDVDAPLSGPAFMFLLSFSLCWQSVPSLVWFGPLVLWANIDFIGYLHPSRSYDSCLSNTVRSDDLSLFSYANRCACVRACARMHVTSGCFECTGTCSAGSFFPAPVLECHLRLDSFFLNTGWPTSPRRQAVYVPPLANRQPSSSFRCSGGGCEESHCAGK